MNMPVPTPAADDGAVCPFCHSYVADVEDHILYMVQTVGDESHSQQESTRPVWTPVYMGEGQLPRCLHCGQIEPKHSWFGRYCFETFLRQLDGDR